MRDSITAEELTDLLEDFKKLWRWSQASVATALGCGTRTLNNWKNGRTSIPAEKQRAISDLKTRLANNQGPPASQASFTSSGDDALATTDAEESVSPDEREFAGRCDQTVRKFYLSVRARNFRQAWSLLTRDFQKRRWRDFTDFATGYDAFRGLTNLVTKGLHPVTPPTCRVFVYYEEASESPDMPGVNRRSSFRLGNIDQCFATLATIQRQLADAGADIQQLAQVSLADLFTQNAGNVLLFASGLGREKFARALGTKGHHDASMSMPCICKVVGAAEGKCQIDQILPVRWGAKAPGM